MNTKMSINALWAAACTGDNVMLSDYYAAGGVKNRRYLRFNTNHSLIAGAFRNGNIDTVDLLLQNGETVMEHERRELREVYYRAVVLAAQALVDHAEEDWYILTAEQKSHIDDIAFALSELKKEAQ